MPKCGGQQQIEPKHHWQQAAAVVTRFIDCVDRSVFKLVAFHHLVLAIKSPRSLARLVIDAIVGLFGTYF